MIHPCALSVQVAGAARDGFMATVGHLLNRRGSAKVEDGAAAASPHGVGPNADGDSAEATLSAGSVDLGAILRTCAQPLSAETLAYLRASGPPRSLLHDDDGSDSCAPSPACREPRASDSGGSAPGVGLSPASGAESIEQRSPVQLQLDMASPVAGLRDGRQHSRLQADDGGLGSTEPSWDGAGLHPLDSDEVSPFEMLLSAPEELAGGFSPLTCMQHGLQHLPAATIAGNASVCTVLDVA